MKNTCLLLLLVPLLVGPSENIPLKGHTANFDVRELSDGVYACINRFGGKAICNAGIVDNGESTIVFDTFLSPDAADELIQLVERLKLSPIRYVVNSHYHNDHVRGNQSFSADVKILSTKRTAGLMKIEEPKEIAAEKVYGPVRFAYYDSLLAAYKGDTSAKEYQIITMNRAYFEELSKSHEKVKTRLPDTYIVKERSLDGSKRHVRLVEKGNGHSESDLVLYLPDESTMFAGDLVFHNCHPYLADGNMDEWKSILAELALMKVKTVVPGHGDVGGTESITAMKTYIESVEAIAQKLRDEGVPREEIKNVRVPERFGEWWLEDFFQANVEYAYDRSR